MFLPFLPSRIETSASSRRMLRSGTGNTSNSSYGDDHPFDRVEDARLLYEAEREQGIETLRSLDSIHTWGIRYNPPGVRWTINGFMR